MIYFLSDAHLGSLAIERSWAHQKKLISLLEHISQDATSVYLMGDMFDFWMEYFVRDKSKRQYAPFFKQIRKMIRAGIHVHFFTGNHDMWTFGGIHKLCGADVHTHPCTIMRYGKSICIAHGDGLLPSDWDRKPSQDENDTFRTKQNQRRIRRFLKLRKIFRSPFLQFCFRCLPPAWGNKFGYEWAKKSRLKEIANPCPYKGEANEELILFAKEQEHLGYHRDYYIFGHRHIELDLQITADSRVLLLGDCFQQWTYAKLDNRGRLSMHTFED